MISKPTQKRYAEYIKAWVDEAAKTERIISVTVGTNPAGRIVLTVEVVGPVEVEEPRHFDTRSLVKR